jgi:DNA-binding transcriptional LysR family regulator
MLDVRRLKVLCEVARHGSFSSAADALGYTQPAISRQIATLEAETGTVLVRRAPQGAVLTDAGRLLVERTEAILAQLNSIEVELQALAGLEGGTLRLATFASAAASIIPLAIAEFRERHPAVEVTIKMADPAESLPLLRAGELDLAISHDPLMVREADTETRGAVLELPGERRRQEGGTDGFSGLELVPLFEDPMYVAMPAGHPLADHSPLGLARFAEEPWMLATSDTCPDSRLFLRACHAAGFEPRIAFQNDDYPAILGFVAAGVGVALVPDMVARGVRDDVVVRELDPAPPPRPIMAAVPAGYRSPAAQAMIDVLQSLSERWVAERPDMTVGVQARAA